MIIGNTNEIIIYELEKAFNKTNRDEVSVSIKYSVRWEELMKFLNRGYKVEIKMDVYELNK